MSHCVVQDAKRIPYNYEQTRNARKHEVNILSCQFLLHLAPRTNAERENCDHHSGKESEYVVQREGKCIDYSCRQEYYRDSSHNRRGNKCNGNADADYTCDKPLFWAKFAVMPRVIARTADISSCCGRKEISGVIAKAIKNDKIQVITADTIISIRTRISTTARCSRNFLTSPSAKNTVPA